jgi:hypothetical protein
VAQSTIRFAAGAGVLAASLLVMGPNPAHAVADKHGSGSNSKHDDSKSDGNGRGNGNGNGRGNGNGNDQKKRAQPNDGTDAGGSDGPAVGQRAPSGPVAVRSAAIADAPTGVTPSDAGPSGTDYSAPPAADIGAPSVVIGDGRSPGVLGSVGETLGDSSLEGPLAPESVPAAGPVDIPPLLSRFERVRSSSLVVGDSGAGLFDPLTGPLAGLAGLILIPAVGAALGYRQARAAQSLGESTRT